MALLNLIFGALMVALGLFEGSGDGGGGDGGSSGKDGAAGGSGSDDGSGGTSSDTDDEVDAGEGTDLADQVAKWKALARKHEGNAKSNATAAKRLRELEDAGKSEIQRASERADTAEKERDDTRAQLLRLEVAGDKGLSLAQAKRLVGSTREELEADADALLKEFGETNGGPRTAPATGLRSRSVPGSEPEETDPHKLADKIPRI